ncbi:hypothetical protein KL923_003801 [Ogataea haglerorum]|nr:hypothetical protein KL923_003801 [Ogataea haglerorum]
MSQRCERSVRRACRDVVGGRGHDSFIQDSSRKVRNFDESLGISAVEVGHPKIAEHDSAIRKKAVLQLHVSVKYPQTVHVLQSRTNISKKCHNAVQTLGIIS